MKLDELGVGFVYHDEGLIYFYAKDDGARPELSPEVRAEVDRLRPWLVAHCKRRPSCLKEACPA